MPQNWKMTRTFQLLGQQRYDPCLCVPAPCALNHSSCVLSLLIVIAFAFVQLLKMHGLESILAAVQETARQELESPNKEAGVSTLHRTAPVINEHTRPPLPPKTPPSPSSSLGDVGREVATPNSLSTRRSFTWEGRVTPIEVEDKAPDSLRGTSKFIGGSKSKNKTTKNQNRNSADDMDMPMHKREGSLVPPLALPKPTAEFIPPYSALPTAESSSEFSIEDDDFDHSDADDDDDAKSVASRPPVDPKRPKSPLFAVVMNTPPSVPPSTVRSLPQETPKTAHRPRSPLFETVLTEEGPVGWGWLQGLDAIEGYKVSMPVNFEDGRDSPGLPPKNTSMVREVPLSPLLSDWDTEGQLISARFNEPYRSSRGSPSSRHSRGLHILPTASIGYGTALPTFPQTKASGSFRFLGSRAPSRSPSPREDRKEVDDEVTEVEEGSPRKPLSTPASSSPSPGKPSAAAPRADFAAPNASARQQPSPGGSTHAGASLRSPGSRASSRAPPRRKDRKEVDDEVTEVEEGPPRKPLSTPASSSPSPGKPSAAAPRADSAAPNASARQQPSPGGRTRAGPSFRFPGSRALSRSPPRREDRKEVDDEVTEVEEGSPRKASSPTASSSPSPGKPSATAPATDSAAPNASARQQPSPGGRTRAGPSFRFPGSRALSRSPPRREDRKEVDDEVTEVEEGSPRKASSPTASSSPSPGKPSVPPATDSAALNASARQQPSPGGSTHAGANTGGKPAVTDPDEKPTTALNRSPSSAAIGVPAQGPTSSKEGQTLKQSQLESGTDTSSENKEQTVIGDNPSAASPKSVPRSQRSRHSGTSIKVSIEEGDKGT